MEPLAVNEQTLARVTASLRLAMPIDVSWHDTLDMIDRGTRAAVTHCDNCNAHHVMIARRVFCRHCGVHHPASVDQIRESFLHEIRHAQQYEANPAGNQRQYDRYEQFFGYTGNPMERDARQYAAARVSTYPDLIVPA